MFTADKILKLINEHGAEKVAKYLSDQFMAQEDRIAELEVFAPDRSPANRRMSLKQRLIIYVGVASFFYVILHTIALIWTMLLQ